MKSHLSVSMFLLVLLCVLSTGNAAARQQTIPSNQSETASISGQVTDNTGTPISGVIISAVGPINKSATTGSDGNYTISDLPEGGYTITPSKSGYIFSPPSASLTVYSYTDWIVDFTGTLASVNNCFSDEFFTSSLSPGWTWVDPLNDSSYSLTENDGSLRIQTPDGGHDLSPVYGTNAPRLVQSISGNFDVATKVTVNPIQSYQAAGLLVWLDGNNFIWIGRGTNNSIGSRYVRAGQELSTPEIQGVINTTVYLRITRNANTISIYYSLDGANWTQTGSNDYPSGPSTASVGMFLINNHQNNPISADFEYFHCAGAPSVTSILVNQGNDDAGYDYTCNYSSTHNEVYFGRCENGGPITSGFRFQNVQIPPGATITEAHLEFTVDGPYSNSIAVKFFGEKSANAATFTTLNGPHNRTLTVASVPWSISDQWGYEEKVNSPNLAAIVQEIVNLPGWANGNALAIIDQTDSTVSGTTHRRVFAWERGNTTNQITRLVVTYSAPPPTYAISGRVTDSNSNAISGVAMNATGPTNRSAMADSSGNYTLTGLTSGTYTLMPNKNGYTFSPPSLPVTVPPNTTEKNFIGIAQQSNNLIPNPSFEEPDPNNPNQPASWSAPTDPMYGVSCGSWDSSTAHSGTHSVKTTQYIECASIWWTTITIPNAPSDYTFSVWYKNTDPCNSVKMQYQGYDENDNSTTNVIVAFTCSSTWKQGITTIPLSQARSVGGKLTRTLKITLLQDINSFTNFWWDDIELVPVIKPWTLMYYLAADNDDLEKLLPYQDDSLKESSKNSNVYVVALVDSTQDTTKYKVFSPTGAGSIDKGELNTGDPETLKQFVTWAQQHYPANHYALIISGHGNGASGVALDYHPRGYDCFFTNAHNCLTLKEFRQALSATKLDIVFMDACIMGSIETAYQLRGIADYYVASEAPIVVTDPAKIVSPAEIPLYYHWFTIGHLDYGGKENIVIPTITASTTPNQLALAIAQSFYGYTFLKTDDPGTISVVRLSKIEDVVAKTSTLAGLLKNQMTTLHLNLRAIRFGNVLQHFEMNGDNEITITDDYVDLYHLAQLVKANIGQPAIQNAAQQLMTAIDNYTVYKKAWNGFVKDENGNPHYWSHANAHSVSILYPWYSSSFYNEDSFDFAAGTTWNINSPGTISASAGTIEWGPMLVEYVRQTNPTHPDDPNPPALMAPVMVDPLTSSNRIYLPTIIKAFSQDSEHDADLIDLGP